MGRRLQVGLAAGEEDYAWHRRRHRPEQALDRLPGHLFHAGLLRRVLAGDDHVGLKEHPRVFDVYQDLRLDYGDQVVLLGERRVECERLGVGPYATLSRDAIPYGDNGPPLGEARP